MYYLLLERNNIETAIPSNSIVQFDTLRGHSETDSLAPPEDIQYQEGGSIDFVRPGIYVILWYVAGMTGLASNGQSYSLKKYDYDAETWSDLSMAANHVKVSSTPGYSVVDISEDEITEHGKATIALLNTADSAIELTFFAPKAVILIFGLNMALIEQELRYIIGEINRIERFIYVSDISRIYSETPILQGISVDIMHVGFEYEFWGTGQLLSPTSLGNGTTYYIITVEQFPKLEFYKSELAVTTLWIETPAGSPGGAALYSLPLRFDETGVYFTPRTNISNLYAGTIFKFTQTMLLIDPNEVPHMLTVTNSQPAAAQE